MVQQIAVSYLSVIVYCSIVVVSSLLVGLLPVYVNPPPCENTDNARVVAVVEERLEPLVIPNNKARFVIEPMEEDKRLDLPVCFEFTVPETGIEEPWFNSRLPSNIRPDYYDLELNLNGSSSYDGYVTITLTITDATDTFIVHKKGQDLVRVEGMFDLDTNPIEVSCYGEYAKNDYYVFKTTSAVQPALSPVQVRFYFASRLDDDAQQMSGLFRIDYGNSGISKFLTASKFQPIEARKAFPCFDEPNMKAMFNLTINHPTNMIALSNSDIDDQEENDNLLKTYFHVTPKLPTYLLSMIVFNSQDFQYREIISASNRQIRLWTRVELVEEGFVDEPLQMAVNILEALENLFDEISNNLPLKIDIFACPNYPTNGIGHWGLVIFREENIMFNSSSAGERDIQNVALLMAEKLAEFYFGNYVTFSWWNELWLQEALAGYIKYELVDQAYPEWNIREQFISDELVDVLIEDSFPSSHPVVKPINTPNEIEEYFDRVERSKAVGVLRMIENEKSQSELIRALQTYLEANAWGTGNSLLFFSQIGRIREWLATDFADRWFLQPNYPLLHVEKRLIPGNRFILMFNQQRALTLINSTGGIPEPYPSPFGWRWYLPVTCLFGNDTQLTSYTFDISESDQSSLIGDGFTDYQWYHCGTNFVGYFSINYPRENWNALKTALANDLNILEPIDRANLIHNLFANAFADRISYSELVEFLTIVLLNEREYLPWRVVSRHVTELESLLHFKNTFYPLTQFFTITMSSLWNTLDPLDSNHTQRLLYETIYELECRLQNVLFLDDANSLWTSNSDAILSIDGDPTANTIDPILRAHVYKYYMQNTINIDDWHLIYRVFGRYLDPVEKSRLAESLAFTRIPSLLAEYLNYFDDNTLDILSRIKHLSINIAARELIWLYYRGNYDELLDTYGLDNPRLGEALYDTVVTFEHWRIFEQLKSFLNSTLPGASANARDKALEKVSTNLMWINLKEKELFGALQIWNRTVESSKLYQIVKL